MSYLCFPQQILFSRSWFLVKMAFPTSYLSPPFMAIHKEDFLFEKSPSLTHCPLSLKLFSFTMVFFCEVSILFCILILLPKSFCFLIPPQIHHLGSCVAKWKPCKQRWYPKSFLSMWKPLNLLQMQPLKKIRVLKNCLTNNRIPLHLLPNEWTDLEIPNWFLWRAYTGNCKLYSK